ncbi:MAG: ribonuclease HI family protein [Minisyncoccia bacterium]|jgi:ribonuclease HI
MKKLIIHSDGGSRGNPGDAAIGVVIEEIGGTLKKQYGEYIGRATNNEAEYQAAIFGLKKLKQLIGKEAIETAKVEVWVDSELLERQINGFFKIEDTNIQPLFLQLWNLRIDYGDIKFKHVPRERNREADKMVNATLDKELNKLI